MPNSIRRLPALGVLHFLIQITFAQIPIESWLRCCFLALVRPVQRESNLGEFRDNSVELALPGSSRRGNGLQINFLRGRAKAEVVGEDVLESGVNYFLGNVSARWIGNLPTFGRIRYRHIYPGTDLVFYGNGTSLEHCFVVAPGGDPAQIRFAIDGAEHWELKRDGSLEIALPAPIVNFQKPKAYQEIAGRIWPSEI